MWWTQRGAWDVPTRVTFVTVGPRIAGVMPAHGGQPLQRHGRRHGLSARLPQSCSPRGMRDTDQHHVHPSDGTCTVAAACCFAPSLRVIIVRSGGDGGMAEQRGHRDEIDVGTQSVASGTGTDHVRHRCAVRCDDAWVCSLARYAPR